MKKYFFLFIVAFFASCAPVEQDVIIEKQSSFELL